MSKKMYFVVAIGGHGLPLPIVTYDEDNCNEEIALYPTRREAVAMAEEQPVCAARGYHVYEWEHCE